MNNPSVAVFNDAAALYMQKYMDVSAYHLSLDELCELLPQGSKVLELASGPGNISRYILNRRGDLKLIATDLAPEMLKLAAANNPEAEVRLLDLNDLHNEAGSYNAIVCGFGFPYLSVEECAAFLASAFGLLFSGGLLYLSFMEGSAATSGIQRSSTGRELYIYTHSATMVAENAAGKAILIHESRVPNTSGLDYICIYKKF